MKAFDIILPLVIFFSITSYISELDSEGPFFWQAEREGETFHILGSIHYGVAVEELQCLGEILNNLKTSHLILIESGLDQEVSQQLRGKLDLSLYDETGKSYQTLSEQSQQFFKNQNLPDSVDLKHLSYYGLLYLLSNLCIRDYPELKDRVAQFRSVSLDRQIIKLAQTQNIKQGYLEDFNTLWPVYELSIKSVTLDYIKEFIDSYDTICSRENIDKFLDIAYINLAEKFKSGEIISIDDLKQLIKQKGVHQYSNMPGMYIDDGALYNTLQNRNKVWTKKLISVHTRYNNVFVVGGFFHFVDDFNVLDMLKKEGYSVKRMGTSCEIQ